MNWNWVYLPPWSTHLVATIAIALLALAALRAWREKRGYPLLALRCVTVGLLLWVMLNPQALVPRERTAKPEMIVLIDSSGSMATPDVQGDSRFAKAVATLNSPGTLGALQREFAINFRLFDRELRSLEPDRLAGSHPDGDATDLAAALMRSVSELGEAPAQAGILVLTDGRATTPDTLDAAQLALARSVPLWTCTLGGPVPRRDLRIETASSEMLAFSGAEVELAATLHAEGYPNRSFKVEVLAGTNRIETLEPVPDADGTARVSTRVTAPSAGEQRYAFRVAADPDEADSANNERAIFLRAVGEKARVLLAEAEPHWDTKFIVQSLRRNPHVDLTAVYRLSASRYLTLVSATGSESRFEQDRFPRTAEALNSFDVIILGRGAEAFFDAATETLLTDFVSKHGGSVVFARGKPYGGRFQPLAKFEPVAWGDGARADIRLQPTEAGRENPIFDLGTAGSLDALLERLPALDHASVTLGEKPLAVVLASSAQSDGPVLAAYQRYGEGKAVSLNASGLWRWAFRESGQEESEQAYERFWISLLQWLLGGSQFLPGSDVALASARRYYTSEQSMQFLITSRNLDREAYRPRLIISSGDTRVELQPRPRGDVFAAEAGPFPPGSYQVSLLNNTGSPAEIQQTVEVVNASREKHDTSSDPELMRELARVSGGRTVTLEEVPRMPEIVRQWEAARQLAHRQRPVWDRGWLLAVVVGLLGVESWLRRREGLL